MKSQFISTTSIFALFAAAPGFACIGTALASTQPTSFSVMSVLNPASGTLALGAEPVTATDLALTALASSAPAVPPASSTVPMGAAAGTDGVEDSLQAGVEAGPAGAVPSAGSTVRARLATIIGKIRNASETRGTSGDTVFVTTGGLNDASDNKGLGTSAASSVAYAFAPSSTSTVTVTMAGGSGTRPGMGGGYYAAAAHSLQTMSVASGGTKGGAMRLSDAAKPADTYTYAPIAASTVAASTVAASTVAASPIATSQVVALPVAGAPVAVWPAATAVVTSDSKPTNVTASFSNAVTAGGDQLAINAAGGDKAGGGQNVSATARVTAIDATGATGVLRGIASMSVRPSQSQTITQYLTTVVSDPSGKPINLSGQMADTFMVGPAAVAAGSPPPAPMAVTVPLKPIVVANSGLLPSHLAMPIGHGMFQTAASSPLGKWTVPEPGSFALLAGAVAGLGGIRRLRRPVRAR